MRRALAVAARVAGRIVFATGWRCARRLGRELRIAAAAVDPPPAFKQCGCGRRYSLAGWRCLPLVGHGLGLEHRNCLCGSTLAVEERPV